MLKKKFKAFGILEAMIASVVIILVLAGAVSLTSSLVKGASIDASYQEAETIAEEIFSQIDAAKATSEVVFLSSAAGDGRFPIECFDNTYMTGVDPMKTNCFSDGASRYREILPFFTLGSSGAYNSSQFDATQNFAVTQNRNKSLSSGFFKFKTDVISGAGAGCVNLNGIDIPNERCRKVIVTVTWEDKNGVQTYKAVERFDDW